MSFYVKSLFFAIPTFIILIFLEMVFERIKGIKVNRAADMISSLSSGITNTIKDGMKFSFVIISYSWIAESITIYKLEPLWLAVIIAFIVQDFSGYWMHRLHHRVNIFWNRHVIHHSSEEFNLSCALRQSISTTFRFSAVLMIPAALLGIPATFFAILAPIHLFLQFWYHTQLIGKLGILEYILVTPSHHRVHHAINPEYLDKNYSQIFIFWDKMFGTFQPELEDVKPVYGTLRPAGTWNPVIINYKHMWQIIKDAWHTKNYIDKIRIWFMPTGWRPDDVEEKYPLKQINNPYNQVKYDTNNSSLMIVWSWIQHIITGILMFHLFIIIPNYSPSLYYFYALFLILHVFSFTSNLDQKQYSTIVEFIKILLGFLLLFYQNYTWFGIEGVYLKLLVSYFLLSFFITYYFQKNK